MLIPDTFEQGSYITAGSPVCQMKTLCNKVHPPSWCVFVEVDRKVSVWPVWTFYVFQAVLNAPHCLISTSEAEVR